MLILNRGGIFLLGCSLIGIPMGWLELKLLSGWSARQRPAMSYGEGVSNTVKLLLYEAIAMILATAVGVAAGIYVTKGVITNGTSDRVTVWALIGYLLLIAEIWATARFVNSFVNQILRNRPQQPPQVDPTRTTSASPIASKEPSISTERSNAKKEQQ